MRSIGSTAAMVPGGPGALYVVGCGRGWEAPGLHMQSVASGRVGVRLLTCPLDTWLVALLAMVSFGGAAS